MKLKDYLRGVDLFGAISSVREFPFITDDTVNELNLLLVLDYGERIVHSALEEVDVDVLARVMVVRYGKQWDKAVIVNTLSENPNNRVILTERTNEDKDSTGSNNTVNKVSGFNSDELISDTGSDSDSVEKQITTRERVSEHESIDVFKAYQIMTLSNKNDIINLVIRDVANFITLSIY